MNGGKALTQAEVASAYARWAPFYDLAFAFVMRSGRKFAVDALGSNPGRVLDVGVGTGLELPLLPANIRVIGIDLSEPMLKKCQRRIHLKRLDNIEALILMDAMRMGFPDACFDAALVPYVLTVVPDPIGTLNEIARVVRPGGQIVLVNHIGSDSGAAAWVESWLDARSTSLGWRPRFPWATVSDWLAARTDVRLIERRSLAPFGLFTLIRIARSQ